MLGKTGLGEDYIEGDFILKICSNYIIKYKVQYYIKIPTDLVVIHEKGLPLICADDIR